VIRLEVDKLPQRGVLCATRNPIAASGRLSVITAAVATTSVTSLLDRQPAIIATGRAFSAFLGGESRK
jgi:hypothetical protein